MQGHELRQILPALPKRLLGRREAVTIAAGFRFADGVVLCADTQITYQGVAKVSGTKIFPFEFKRNGSRAVFTFSGDLKYAKGGITKCVRAIAKLHSSAVSLSDHPKPANEYHLKTGQREQRPGH